MKPDRRPADIARRSAQALAGRSRARDAFRRETFALPRDAAREKAREMFRRFPKAAYMTEVESWRVLPGPDRIYDALASERGLIRLNSRGDSCSNRVVRLACPLSPRKNSHRH